jgi:predicted ATPase
MSASCTSTGWGARKLAIIADLTGGKALPPDILDQIILKTDGVPMFIEELTKSVLESGILRDEGGRYVVNGTPQLLAIPATLHDSLLARLDRLAATREIAQIGAAIGREFSYRLLAALAPAGQLDLGSALTQLTAAELIFSQGVPPDSLYVFKHALVQDAAYESLLRSQRQALHGRIADVMAEQFPDVAETEPELVAHHLASAGRVPEAVASLLRAGEHAIQRSAVIEAISLLERALQLHSTLSSDRAGRRVALKIEVLLAQAMIPGRSYAAPETRAMLLRARELIDDDTEAGDMMSILYGLWVSDYVGGDVARQREAAAEFMMGAVRHGDPVSLCIANRALGNTHFAMGDFTTARRHLDRARELSESNASDPFQYQFGQDIRASVLCYLALVQWHLGGLEQARATAEAAIERARALSNPFTLAYTLGHASGLLAMCRRDPKNLLSDATSIIELSDEHGFPFWGAGGRILRGWALARGGECDQGLAEMTEGLSLWAKTGARLWVSFFLAAKAEVLLECGRVQEALADVDQALALADETGERWAVPEVLRVKASIVLRSSDQHASDEAEALLRRSIQVAQAQGAASWRLRASCDLDRLLRRRGRTEEGLRLLKSAYAEFDASCEEPDLRTAHDRIEESTSALLETP